MELPRAAVLRGSRRSCPQDSRGGTGAPRRPGAMRGRQVPAGPIAKGRTTHLRPGGVAEVLEQCDGRSRLGGGAGSYRTVATRRSRCYIQIPGVRARRHAGCRSGGPAPAAHTHPAAPSPTPAPSVAASVAPAGIALAGASPEPAAHPARLRPRLRSTIAVPAKRADLQRSSSVICSDYPVFAAGVLRSSGNATGSDIGHRTEIARRLGLTAQVQNSVFDTIIAALQGGKCDVIISAQKHHKRFGSSRST